MNALIIPTWIVLGVMVIYTFGFSIELWKEKNKTGSIAIFTLIMAAVVTSYFSILR